MFYGNGQGQKIPSPHHRGGPPLPFTAYSMTTSSPRTAAATQKPNAPGDPTMPRANHIPSHRAPAILAYGQGDPPDPNQYKTALERIRWVMRQHPAPVVAWSGGKDSTLLLEMAIEVAVTERKLPVDTLWLDTEAEYQATVDLARATAARPEIRFHWVQAPVDVTESDVPGAPLPFRTWTLRPPFREKEPSASSAPDLRGHNYFNAQGDDTLTVFSQAASALLGRPVAILDAQRTEEGPVQHRAIRQHRRDTRDGIPWSWEEPGDNSRYAPIAEWTAAQVWRAIADRGCSYNAAYDRMAQLSVPIERARVGTLYRHVMTRAGLLRHMDPQAYRSLEAQLPRLAEIPVRDIYDPSADALNHQEG